MSENAHNILLVEDDKFLSTLLLNRLQKEGFTVWLAGNAEEATKILTEKTPELILLDLILPGKFGFDMLDDLRADPQLSEKAKVPVIVVSNLGQEADLERGKELGVIDYFVKARISIDELIKRVKSFFETGA